MWQQIGRAGRAGRHGLQDSISVLVAGDDQLDQWFANHPTDLFERPPEPVVVNVMANGDFYLSIDGQAELIDSDTLITKVSAFVRQNPEIQVLIGGDRSVGYGRVYEALVALQQAGVAKVGLMSDPLEEEP